MNVVRTKGLASILALGIASLALASHEADACVIIVPMVVLPRLQPAPTNTHVWMQGLEASMYAGGDFVLTEAAGPAVPLSLRQWPESMVWELVPAHELKPRARYEVWGVPVPKTKKPTTLLGTFRTGDAPDHVAPSPPVVKRLEQRPSAVSCPPFLFLEGSAGTDASGEVFHAMWVTTVRGGIDYAAPPAFVFSLTKATKDRPVPSAELVNRVTPRRAGVRAIDVAGNLSAPVEVDVGP